MAHQPEDHYGHVHLVFNPSADPFARPTWQAAFNANFRAELEQAAQAVPISQRPVNPDLPNHGCGGPLGCSIH
jgi:hypothetical protein